MSCIPTEAHAKSYQRILSTNPAADLAGRRWRPGGQGFGEAKLRGETPSPVLRRWLGALAVLMAALGLAHTTARAADAPRPNIVLILVDDMGYSDIAPYGGEIETPHLTRLAEGGLRFTDFHNTGRCCPTRASLLTGLYPHQTGVGHMMDDRGTDGYRGDLNRRCVTIAEVLKSAGYATYMAGKWHVTRFTGPEGPKHNWPLQRGFDRYLGTITGAGNYWAPKTFTRDNMQLDEEFPEGFYYTDAIADQTAQYIREHCRSRAEQPFFCYVAFTAPHWPLHAHEEVIRRYRGRYLIGWDKLRQERFARQKAMGLAQESWELSPRMPGLPAWDELDEQQKDQMDLLMSIYAAMITEMDAGVGQIVAALKETGTLNETVIFFLSDNGGCAEGGALGSLGLRQPGARPGGPDSHPMLGGCWANANNTPFRWWKHYVHEGGAATPLIVHWPAGIDAKHNGSFRRQPGHLIDIMPTCVELCGAAYPRQFAGHEILPLEGRSLLPAFDNLPLQREAIYFEHEGHCAVLVGNWKLVSLDRGQTWELYDLSRDRAELHDLAAAEPERVNQMAAQWFTWAKRTQVIPWPGQQKKPQPPAAKKQPPQ